MNNGNKLNSKFGLDTFTSSVVGSNCKFLDSSKRPILSDDGSIIDKKLLFLMLCYNYTIEKDIQKKMTK